MGDLDPDLDQDSSNTWAIIEVAFFVSTRYNVKKSGKNI